MCRCQFQPLEWSARFRVPLCTSAGFLCQPAPPRQQRVLLEQMGADSSYKKSSWWDSHVRVQSRCLYLSQSLKYPSLAVLRNNSSSHPKADPCTRGSWVLVQLCWQWREPAVTRTSAGTFSISPKAQEICLIPCVLTRLSRNFAVIHRLYPPRIPMRWRGSSPPIRANSRSLSRRQVLCGTPRKTVSIQMLKPSPLRPSSRFFLQGCSWCH